MCQITFDSHVCKLVQLTELSEKFYGKTSWGQILQHKNLKSGIPKKSKERNFVKFARYSLNFAPLPIGHC